MADGFRNLRLFIAVYEERSFTAAAAREHATQSGVSQHIRKLEQRLGVALFSRGPGAVTPTPAGDRYYAGCLRMLRRHEELHRAMRQFEAGLQGEIVVGLMPTMTRCTLAPALMRFGQAHPNVVVRIVEGYSGALTQQVRAGELDFAIVPAGPRMAGLESRHFSGSPELLVSGAGCGFEHLAPVSPARLAPLKLAAPGRQNIRRSRIETYLASNGVRIERVLEMDSMFGTLDFVAKTDWVAVLPAMMMAADIHGRELVINMLADPPFVLDLVAIEPSRTVMSPAARAFLDMLGEEAGRANRLVAEAALPRARRRAAGRRSAPG